MPSKFCLQYDHLSITLSKILEKSGLNEICYALGELHMEMADIVKAQKEQQLEQLRVILMAEVEKLSQAESTSYKAKQKKVKKENRELREAWKNFEQMYHTI